MWCCYRLTSRRWRCGRWRGWCGGLRLEWRLLRCGRRPIRRGGWHPARRDGVEWGAGARRESSAKRGLGAAAPSQQRGSGGGSPQV